LLEKDPAEEHLTHLSPVEMSSHSRAVQKRDAASAEQMQKYDSYETKEAEASASAQVRAQFT
jgi:hypothetical protein